jgi:hypothetical protein
MPPRKLELNTEYPEPDEAEVSRVEIEHDKALMDRAYAPGGFHRAFHPKTHAVVRGTLVCESDLDERLRVGVFKEPRTWPVWIRFSNAGETVEPDIKPDLRGAALKLVGVEGEKLLESQRQALTQDFVFFTQPRFFTPDAGTLSRFLHIYRQRRHLRTAWYLVRHPRLFLNILKFAERHSNVLELWYYSATPYMLGTRAVKYLLRPHKPPSSTLPKNPSENYLRERLKQDLTQSESCFDFLVQFQADPYKTPVEDASVEWKESVAPYHKVATLIIPPQTFDSPEQLQFGENLSMNPWHCLPEHRPIGNINRIRKRPYELLSRYRHERNRVPVEEPTLASFEQFPSGVPNVHVN